MPAARKLMSRACGTSSDNPELHFITLKMHGMHDEKCEFYSRRLQPMTTGQRGVYALEGYITPRYAPNRPFEALELGVTQITWHKA